MPGGDAIATKGKTALVSPPFSEKNGQVDIYYLVVPHQMSLGPNPAARTDACGATPGNRKLGPERGRKRYNS